MPFNQDSGTLNQVKFRISDIQALEGQGNSEYVYIDTAGPEAQIGAPCRLKTPSIPITWTASDGVGSGVANYDVQVRVDGGGRSGWSGDLSGDTNPESITMDEDKAVTATFTEIPPEQYDLTVNVVGNGSVILDPAGGTYDEGTIVQLTAEADPGWAFSGWSGDLSGDTNPDSIAMDRDKTVTATFAEIAPEEYTLTVNVVGNGSVTLNPAGGTYVEGTVVQLTAIPHFGWAFSGWSVTSVGTRTPHSSPWTATRRSRLPLSRATASLLSPGYGG